MATEEKIIRIKDFFIKHETKIVILIGFILVSLISFEAGVLKGRTVEEKAIVIEKPLESSKIEPEDQEKSPVANNSGGEVQGQNIANIDKNQKSCIFVGSKNSTKYHLPTCQWAKKIKPENAVCFFDENDAKLKGYLPDKGCIK